VRANHRPAVRPEAPLRGGLRPQGLGVKADDLIDKLIETMLAEVTSRHEAEPEESRRRAATVIAIGALRYFMLKYTRNSVIAFDFAEALSFEGETGPYVQYAAVRARNILKKLETRGETLPDFAAILTREAMDRQLANEDCWQLLLAASKAGSAIERAVASGEPSHVARYAFQLAQAFRISIICSRCFRSLIRRRRRFCCG